MTSVVASVEVGRLARRADPDAPRRAGSILARVASLPLDPGVVLRAIGLEPLGLRSLDTIHVATALSLGRRLSALCTYDARMSEAALRADVRVTAPAP